MEFCKPLSVFFGAVKNDPRISITHIGLFATILEYWQTRGFPVPLCAYAHEIMPMAKILANTTYHRCIRDLHDFGYIIYQPSYKRNERSRIILKCGEKSDE
ncbi:hypothetical protein D0C36_15680 [Mucilaginibacter conchicola]|uniref:Uncharacterized protein n=1 Tax=Mucilaginibacter conchicola TaxID=2303333 RepID=A0A372NUN8_9SPHI|nr:hypothetical protein D0C36_15680 [Mucilaginibacter conchicola]